ncbi:class I SAM-dependent methyltransferase [Flammeovirgaceae bacterium SG7u.111]|nr:class I SAM-dependent methyltransferase [Flammeovirgaceae bacterium SG7u.132]WPO38107.1 class I SAM-dependent methyltransferase [Flammeovirgaceae bacterium SG7u.111]
MKSPIDPNRDQLYAFSKGEKFEGEEMNTVFLKIFEERGWDLEEDAESVSGIGSNSEQTAEIVRRFPRLLDTYGVETLLDLPCGDFNWMQKLDWSGRNYIGGDIVPQIISKNRTKFDHPNIRFVELDLTSSVLPKADVILCRDCLVHLSFADIHKALANIKRSELTYLLITTFPEQPFNKDIVTGGWRPLNFELAPFHFPKPLALINEKCTELGDTFRDKSLGLWKVADL